MTRRLRTEEEQALELADHVAQRRRGAYMVEASKLIEKQPAPEWVIEVLCHHMISYDINMTGPGYRDLDDFGNP